jgi:hypothetical protein
MNRREKVDYLISMLKMSRTPRVFEIFHEALVKSRQDALAELIENAKGEESEVDTDASEESVRDLHASGLLVRKGEAITMATPFTFKAYYGKTMYLHWDFKSFETPTHFLVCAHIKETQCVW